MGLGTPGLTLVVGLGTPGLTLVVELGTPGLTLVVGLGTPGLTLVVGLGTPGLTLVVGLGTPGLTLVVGLGTTGLLSVHKQAMPVLLYHDGHGAHLALANCHTSRQAGNSSYAAQTLSYSLNTVKALEYCPGPVVILKHPNYYYTD